MSTPLKGVCVGAGYFSRFQYEAWNRLPEVTIVANCNRSVNKAVAFAKEFNIPKSYSAADFDKMLSEQKPDFVDIITPPDTHLAFCDIAAQHDVHVICQKPLAPDWEDTLEIAEVADHSKGRYMVHENWRWQPWYREIKKILEAGTLGDFFHLNFNCRLGDGWGQDAYLERQPFFRDYPRLFIFETGVHFLDTFRYLFGEVESLYATTAQRNPVIKGEDSAIVHCNFVNGGSAILDANRYNESSAENPRYTFGTLRLDGSKGHLELDTDGRIFIQLLGQARQEHQYAPSKDNFAGDCVYALQKHFVDNLLNDKPFESTIPDYLKSVQLVESAYHSASTNQVATF